MNKVAVVVARLFAINKNLFYIDEHILFVSENSLVWVAECILWLVGRMKGVNLLQTSFEKLQK